jgi:hypothetical protein
MENEYSDDEMHQNYLFLQEAIRHVQSGQRITEDWMEEHKERILLYRDFWHNISLLNPDIKERRFRSLAVEAETLITLLTEEIYYTKTFSVETYHTFNMCMSKMTDAFLDDDDFAEMFSAAKISK